MKVLFVLVPPLHFMEGGVQHTTIKLGRFFFLNSNYDVEYYSFSNKGHQDEIFGKLYFSPEGGSTENYNNINHFYGYFLSSKPDFVINQMPYDVALTSVLKNLKATFDFKLLGCIRNSLFGFILNHEEIILKKLGIKSYPFLKVLLPSFLIEAIHKIKHRGTLRQILEVHDKVVLLTQANLRELFFLSVISVQRN